MEVANALIDLMKNPVILHLYVNKRIGMSQKVAHLEHCEHFECSSMFKCPESFCIPHRRVCDGIIDCIYGEDEQQCDNYKCPGKHLCKWENIWNGDQYQYIPD